MHPRPAMRPFGLLLATAALALPCSICLRAQQTAIAAPTDSAAAPTDSAAAPAAAPVAAPAHKLSASEAYFESMKGNHAPVLTKGSAVPATEQPVASAQSVSSPSVSSPSVASPSAASVQTTTAPAVPAVAGATAPAVDQSAAPAPPATGPASTTAAAAKPAAANAQTAGEVHKHGMFHHEKAPKLVPVTIQRGVLTVDGWTGKADLNYHITDLEFLYVWVPGSGIVVISNQMFPGSKFQPDAFDGNSLTVKAEDHQVQLTSDRHLLNDKKPEGAYVAIDREGTSRSVFPLFGYGHAAHGPYEWPSSMADDKHNPNAPPLPVSVRPNLETVQLCHTNPDGTKSDCHTVAVPMDTSKTKS